MVAIGESHKKTFSNRICLKCQKIFTLFAKLLKKLRHIFTINQKYQAKKLFYCIAFDCKKIPEMQC